MDINSILEGYNNLNEGIDDTNAGNLHNYNILKSNADSQEESKTHWAEGLVGGKTVQALSNATSYATKGALARIPVVADVAKTAKTITKTPEELLALQRTALQARRLAGRAIASETVGGAEATTVMPARAGVTGLKLGAGVGAGAEAGASGAKAGLTATQLASKTPEELLALAKTAGGTGARLAQVADVLGKGGAVLGAGIGVYDAIRDIDDDFTGHFHISLHGDNTQEKAGDLGNMIGGGLDAVGLATGQPELLLAGAIAGGIGALLNLWGGHKDHEQVKQPPKPPVVSNVKVPDFASMGMVQNHMNNIKQMVN